MAFKLPVRRAKPEISVAAAPYRVFLRNGSYRLHDSLIGISRGHSQTAVKSVYDRHAKKFLDVSTIFKSHRRKFL